MDSNVLGTFSYGVLDKQDFLFLNKDPFISSFEFYNHDHTNSYLTLITTQSRVLTTLEKKPFESIVGKGENAGNQRLILFPQYFLVFLRQIPTFESHLFIRLQMLSIWTSLKIRRSVKT